MSFSIFAGKTPKWSLDLIRFWLNEYKLVLHADFLARSLVFPSTWKQLYPERGVLCELRLK
jgi:hypothetical protein